MTRKADLADKHNVERDAERLCDHVGHGQPATRERYDDCVFGIKRPKSFQQSLTGLTSVREHADVAFAAVFRER